MAEFSGLGMHLGNLSRLSKAKSRSISPENFSGEPGKGGWSMFMTSGSMVSMVNPALNGYIRGQGQRGWTGWYAMG